MRLGDNWTFVIVAFFCISGCCTCTHMENEYLIESKRIEANCVQQDTLQNEETD